jgi:hypothetical protein
MRGQRYWSVNERKGKLKMALGLVSENSGGGGNIVPILKYDARGGDFFRVERSQNGAGDWQSENIELPLPIELAVDMDGIEVGWLGFVGGRPDFRMVKLGEAMPQKPSDDHKQAFRVRLCNREVGLREFSSQSKMVLSAFDQLHNQFEAERANNPGLCPVMKITGTKTITVNTPQGEQRFKVPEWSISQWIERPSAFDGADEAPSAAVPTPAAPVQQQDAVGADLF